MALSTLMTCSWSSMAGDRAHDRQNLFATLLQQSECEQISRSASNLRTQLHRIIKNAGLKPWPKLWQNLRSTRETELVDRFPAHVASSWIGNSVEVATQFYLQVTERHFADATGALQNALQQAHGAHGSNGTLAKSRQDSAHCNSVQDDAERTDGPGGTRTRTEGFTSSGF